MLLVLLVLVLVLLVLLVCVGEWLPRSAGVNLAHLRGHTTAA
jgi:hypothetical protein